LLEPEQENVLAMFSKRLPEELSVNRLSRLLAARRASGGEVLDLTESNPTNVGLRYEGIELVAKAPRSELLSYRPTPQGNEAARAAVADYYREHGRRVATDNIFLTASTSEAYGYLFKLLADPGDEILVPRPSYPLFEGLVRLESLRPVQYPLQYTADRGWRIDPERVRNLISTKTRAIVVVNPNNPTGSRLLGEELAGLSEICAAFGLALIVDEVFLDYPRAGMPPANCGSAAANRTALTFILSGLSKIVCLPQMKISWIAASGPEMLLNHARERLEYIADMYLSVASEAQLTVPALLRQRLVLQAEVQKRLTKNEACLRQAVAGSADVRMLHREAGWYTVLQLADAIDEEELSCRLLEETGVIMHPGYFYDFAREGFMVCSLLPRTDIFARGIRLFMDQLKQQMA
jgi:hypothetical protein